MPLDVNASVETLKESLKIGLSDAYWRRIQTALVRRYYLAPDKVTGKWNHETAMAVAAYQFHRSKGQFYAFSLPLVVDGIPGPKTAQRLLPKTVAVESAGDLVRLLQEILHWSGYNPGSVDGKFGPNTEKAVREFQSYNDDYAGEPLEVDGIVGVKTWVALWS